MSALALHFAPSPMSTGADTTRAMSASAGRRLIVTRRIAPLERSARITVYRRASMASGRLLSNCGKRRWTRNRRIQNPQTVAQGADAAASTKWSREHVAKAMGLERQSETSRVIIHATVFNRATVNMLEVRAERGVRPSSNVEE